MTAIYAMYSKKNRQVAIAADDLEEDQGVKVNKIRFIANRFVVGICGVESPIQAIDSVVKQIDEQKLVKELTSVQVIVEELLGWIESFVAVQFKEHFGKPENAKLFAKLSQMDTSIILFDVQDFQLFEIELGKILPPRKLDAKVIKAVPLADNILNLFALARNARGGRKTFPLPNDVFSGSKEFLEAHLAMDRSNIEAHNKTATTDQQIPPLGGMGAYFQYRDGNAVLSII